MSSRHDKEAEKEEGALVYSKRTQHKGCMGRAILFTFFLEAAVFCVQVLHHECKCHKGEREGQVNNA